MEKEIRDREILEELLSTAMVCRIGLAPGPKLGPGPPPESSGHPGGDSPGRGGAGALYPYVVPVHFVHSAGSIYIHSAQAGTKIEMIGHNPRICVEIDEFLGLETADRACGYGTHFRSLIALGRATIVEDSAVKHRALRLLMEKYSGRNFEFSESELQTVAIIEIRIEEMSGKQA
jgi:nitroimidazol reductase NimA-like FMN-containing flavoprotein (pyridoxamine 5'-phosphate oxidase superfamily)